MLQDSSDWLVWCYACHHGGHSSHITGWFASHSECPVNGCSCHCSEIWSVCSTKKGMRAVEEADCDGVKEGFQVLAGATAQQEPFDPSCLGVIGSAMSHDHGSLIVVRFCDDVNTDREHAVLVSSVDVCEVPVSDHHDFARLDRGP